MKLKNNLLTLATLLFYTISFASDLDHVKITYQDKMPEAIIGTGNELFIT
ncbi:hypothetical protein K4L44_04210 [Halosquirtibacter laminarini]|uniref:Uncharacterized protein n=1 Tax=Halosquirtibacter laminarini TaxID=3374600 RepID=A0AC61NHL7_9BACT|nr:hypothetical protein K4L44_04210 [Prolixibacteraceae bacterium]